ncbi:hypothetical protein IFM89_014266 [Coptis chinensis]|uniref:ABC1 atypical kinase-like domain-containing protein n=1 Tax=Coptis chinensis TaxID=261450 RepID=A0A835H2U0_9MAGN|nr:hypothetical protein IFM89_014266 [Coptis chinensis]
MHLLTTLHPLRFLDTTINRRNHVHVSCTLSLILQRWYFVVGNIRRARSFFVGNHYSEGAKRNGPHVIVRPASCFYRLYSLYRFSSKRHAFFPISKAKQNLYTTCAHNFPALSRRKTMTQLAQIAWKRLHQRGSYKGLSPPPISRIARSVSLVLNRSRLVTLGVFSFLVGKVAGSQRTLADAAEYLPTRNSLYMQAQDAHISFSSFMFLVLEGFVLFARAVYLSILFLPTIAMAPFADSFGVQFRKTWLHFVHVTLEKAGPAFIKWGQWAATRPDLFPRDLCIELSKLHSAAPEHSFSYTKKTIEKAFGRKLLEVFDDFEEAPLASGSVAQVHRATLKYRYPGKKVKPMVVAVKVRHPGVSESIRRDFVIIHIIARISNFIPTLKWLRLDESVQQFAVFMMSQVDLSREAAHLMRFNYNFRYWKNLSFPKPLYPLVHPAVLVETYEKGESVSRYIDDGDVLVGDDRTKRALAHIGTDALLKMLLEDNFIHADMHPGNILVRVAQEKPKLKGFFKSKPHLIFLDVGMTAELSSNDRGNLVEFFKAVAIRDGRSAAECTLRFSKKQNCPDPNAFIEEVEKSFTFWGTKEGDVVHPAECMHQLLEKVRRHKVNVDGNVTTVMVTICVLEFLSLLATEAKRNASAVPAETVSASAGLKHEKSCFCFLLLGWQQKLDPDYDIMKKLQSLLFKASWIESLEYTIFGVMAP